MSMFASWGGDLTGQHTRDRQRTETNTEVYATEEEKELNKLLLQQYKDLMPEQTQNMRSQYALLNQLLSGQTPSSGVFQALGGITEQQTQSMSQKAVQDVLPSFQNLGLADSGVALSAAARTAGDIRNANAQFNVTNALSVLNSILGGSASASGQTSGVGSQLSTNLAGLRSGRDITEFKRQANVYTGHTYGNFSNTPTGTGGGKTVG